MKHTLTLEVPDEVYSSLLQRARLAGQTPEELAVRWLSNAVSSSTEDPIEKFIGAFDSGLTNLGSEHDRYLGQQIVRETHQPGDKDNP